MRNKYLEGVTELDKIIYDHEDWARKADHQIPKKFTTEEVNNEWVEYKNSIKKLFYEAAKSRDIAQVLAMNDDGKIGKFISLSDFVKKIKDL